MKASLTKQQSTELLDNIGKMIISDITRVSVELGARGTVHIMSMPATPIDDFLANIKRNRK